jgi:CheY-like chemotaxis protein
LGVEVFSVASGEEAVEAACSGKHEFILMDIQMDGIDGLEATRRIRSHEKKHGGHIPIVAITAHAMVGDREKCLRAGMDEYLRKPVDRKEILEVLTDYLRSRALVVDSDIESQNIFVKNLVESGWQVTIAETKRSAMYEATLNHFDLIILDTSSSQIKGLEAVKTIRQLEQYTGQRATIISLDEDSAAQEKQDENEFDGTIVRPVTREKLLAHLSV